MTVNDPVKPWQAYVFALVATAATLATRLALDGQLSGQPTLLIFTVPMILSAYLGGWRGGLLATVLSYLAASYYLLAPLHSVAVALGAKGWQQFFMVLSGVVISVSNEALHRARRRADLAALEHEQIENAFRESNDRFHQLADNITDAFWIRSPDMRELHYVSPAFERIWGRTVESLYANPELWSEFILPVDRERVRGAFAALVGDAPSLDIEYRISRPGGEIRWVRVRGFQVRDATGQLIRHIGIVTDITERQRAADALGTSLLEISRTNRSLMTVAAGVSAAAGPQFFEQLARTMVDALGAKAGFVAQLLTDHPRHARTIAAVAEGTVMDNFDVVLDGPRADNLLTSDACVVSKDVGELFGASWPPAVSGQSYVGRRLHGSSGEPLGLLFVVFQEPLAHVEFVTSTLQILAARAASELDRQRTDAHVGEQAALLDIAHEAIQVKDLEGRILYWSKGAERTYGWTADEVLGRTSIEMLGQDRSTFREAQTALLAKDEWHGEMAQRTKSGRDMIVEARWTLVRDAKGLPKSILAINADISEKKKLESQFLRAQRMEGIGTLAAGIAHDLNNVLAPILMSVGLLKDATMSADDLALLETLESSAQRGADLVRQVLSFARGVEGERVTVNPLNLMRELLTVMRDTFPKSIDVQFTPAADLWTVTGDSTQMHQVFLNLCVNARDAMPRGGRLSITMGNVVLDETAADGDSDARAGAYVMVQVADTGTGIPRETRDRIFEPFFTTKGFGKGTGLGLSTTLAIVKSHGGFIHLDSELGAGTMFKVYLPANTIETAAGDAALDDTRLPRGHGELVLVVDDEEAIRTIARRMLERFGYRVLLASNGEEAASLYARRQPDIAVVLTDMAMPIMDGPALIIALMTINPQVRIIGSSGLASSSGVARAVGTRIQHFVPKPYTAETMLTTLQEVLS